MSKTAILILSAGESKRLGKPKQLLPYKNSTLLEYTIDQVKNVPNSQIFIVVGAYFQEVFNLLRGKKVAVVKNNDWSKGMGSSISKGITFLQKKGNFDQVLVTLTDLPLLDETHYTEMVEAFKLTPKRILLTEFDTHQGVPAVFCKSLFNELSHLDSDEGAKPVIKKYNKVIATIKSKAPYFDVDTEDAYKKLISF